jgi:hypothetical protein
VVNEDQDGIGRRFDDGAVAGLAFPQGQFRLLAGADIELGAGHAHRMVRRIGLENASAIVQPNPMARFVAQPVFDVDKLAGPGDDEVVMCPDTLQVVRVDAIHPLGHGHLEFPRGITQQFEVPLVHRHLPARHAGIAGAEDGTGQSEFELLAGLGQLRFGTPALCDVLETGIGADNRAPDPQGIGMHTQAAPLVA